MRRRIPISRARYYGPKIGRFISEDPLGFDGGDVNLYVYGANNPVVNADPTGLFYSHENINDPVINREVATMTAIGVSAYAGGYALTGVACEYLITMAYLGTHGAIATGRAGMNLARRSPRAVQAGEAITNFIVGASVPGPPPVSSGPMKMQTSGYAGLAALGIAGWLYENAPNSSCGN